MPYKKFQLREYSHYNCFSIATQRIKAYSTSIIELKRRYEVLPDNNVWFAMTAHLLTAAHGTEMAPTRSSAAVAGATSQELSIC